MDKIRVDHIEAKPKMEEWIARRGGVQVWENQDLSNPSRGRMFSPALGKDGQTPTPLPHWAYKRGEVVRDIDRFEFVKDWIEVKRFRVAVRIRGFKMLCTAASTKKIEKALADNPGTVYSFDYETQEAVIQRPVF